MNGSEFAKALSQEAGITIVQAERVLEIALRIISDALSRGDRVHFYGFGIFQMKARASRVGRDPGRGIPIQVPAKKVPCFTPGKRLKDAVNGKR